MSEPEKLKSKLLKLLPNGDGVIHYASGNLAVIICKQASGQLITFMSDSLKSKVLANFNHLGEGAVNYASGKPWVVLTGEGYIVSDRKGNVTERGKWPRTSTEAVTCEIDDSVVISFRNKQDITARFTHEDVVMSWQCGECLRRTEPYTSGVVGGRRGKLELDVGRIRERQNSVGSLYVPAGPLKQPTELPGIGSLRVALRKTLQDEQLGSTIDDLRNLDERMMRVTTLPPGTLTVRSLPRSSSSAGMSSSGTLGETLTDYGSPQLSDVQKKYKPTMRTPNPNTPPVNYRLRRKRLTRIDVDSSGAWEARVIGEDAPSDVVVFVCVLAAYNPLCARVEAQLESACFDMAEAAAANSAAELARVQMLRVDAAQSRILQERYGFCSTPMFLLFYEGKLVWTSNDVRTAEEAKRVALDALLRGRKKEFLPDNFRARGIDDNSMLDELKNADAVSSRLRGLTTA